MKPSTNGTPWYKIEADLRAWAFHVYFDKSFSSENEPWLRFLKALKASRRPIRRPELVLWWYEHEGPITDDDIKTLSI